MALDWHLFIALTLDDTDEGLLRALEYAHGPVAEPHQPRRYAWLARDPVTEQMPAYVVDVVSAQAARYLQRAEFNGAVAVTRAALRVEPQSCVLWDQLVTAVRGRDGSTAVATVEAQRAAALLDPTAVALSA
ncbi:MAG: hypothetical protein ACR2JQ_11705 [Mycobacteriales bacterium]